MGFEEATPIQEGTITFGMEGRDVIGQAQTGTGKTAAFGIPIIEKIDVNNPAVQALVIAPTRELAIQVSEEIYKIGYGRRARVLAVYGGQEIGRQIRALRNNPQIIVGTPGRILDHINRKTLKLNNVNTLVLDEADEMLNMGFIEDINTILASFQIIAKHFYSRNDASCNPQNCGDIHERAGNGENQIERNDCRKYRPIFRESTGKRKV